MVNIKAKINKLICKVRADKKVLAVLLFGSRARKENHKDSDIDICLVLYPGKYSALVLSNKKLEYLKEFNMDVNIFQQMPVYIRNRIIKDAKVLFCEDEKKLYQLVFKSISEFNRFKYIYDDYLKEAGSVR